MYVLLRYALSNAMLRIKCFENNYNSVKCYFSNWSSKISTSEYKNYLFQTLASLQYVHLKKASQFRNSLVIYINVIIPGIEAFICSNLQFLKSSIDLSSRLCINIYNEFINSFRNKTECIESGTLFAPYIFPRIVCFILFVQFIF